MRVIFDPVTCGNTRLDSMVYYPPNIFFLPESNVIVELDSFYRSQNALLEFREFGRLVFLTESITEHCGHFRTLTIIEWRNCHDCF